MFRSGLRWFGGWLILAWLLACNLTGSLIPAAPTATSRPPKMVPSPQPPTMAPSQPAASVTQPGVCILSVQQDTPVYERPSTAATLFGTLPAGATVTVTQRTADGWYGFDPGVAQAGNTGIFRLRWVQAAANVTLSGPCDALPVVASLPPDVCFAVPLTTASVYAHPQPSATVLGTLNPDEYAAAVARGPDDWVRVNLDLGANNLSGQGWVRLAEVGLNGPCDHLPQHQQPQAPTATPVVTPQTNGGSTGEERIQFALGAISWQKVLGPQENAFVFNATQGQSVEILVQQGDQPAAVALALAAPGGQPLQTYNIGRPDWRGVLPQTGDYHLSLSAPQDVQGLTLTVTIYPLPGDPHPLSDAALGYHLVYDGHVFLPQAPPPVFTNAAVSLYLAQDDFYMNTNLEEAYFVLAQESYNDADTCLNAPPEGVMAIAQAVDTWRINRVDYRHYVTQEGAAGHAYRADVFRAWTGAHCVTAYLFVHTTNLSNYDPGMVTPYDEQGVLDELKRVFFTLRWH